MNITNKVAIVTGASSGLGMATAKHLIESGAQVALFDIQEDKGSELEALLGDKARFFATDVTSADSVTASIAAVKATFGGCHICVNCAGIAPAGKTVGRKGPLALNAFSKTVEINLIGTFNVLRLAAELMIECSQEQEKQRGVIINTASVAAFDGQVGQAAYSASKAGVAGMTLPIARDLGPQGIRVNSIAPGVFDTPMMQGMPENVRAPLEQLVQSPQRLGYPEEFAALAVHIIENDYINGETIRLDGGIRMPAA